jgi:uncharacterized glyoxalase superfamily protein PhnB
MKTINMPDGHQTVMPYLMLDGAARFKNFVINVLDGKITSTHLRPENSDLIMHSEVDINGSTIMFCDSREDWPAHPANMFVYVANADETYQKALSEGGISIMEPADQDYGRSCGVSDPCGNVWWITSVA